MIWEFILTFHTNLDRCRRAEILRRSSRDEWFDREHHTWYISPCSKRLWTRSCPDDQTFPGEANIWMSWYRFQKRSRSVLGLHGLYVDELIDIPNFNATIKRATVKLMRIWSESNALLKVTEAIRTRKEKSCRLMIERSSLLRLHPDGLRTSKWTHRSPGSRAWLICPCLPRPSICRPC